MIFKRDRVDISKKFIFSKYFLFFTVIYFKNFEKFLIFNFASNTFQF